MKTIMQLRDIEGYDFEEIAGILGMTENAIRVNLSRARKKVREIMINKKLYEFERN
jgi:RNA polymerase sigma-70 factor (ECF subfamily)